MCFKTTRFLSWIKATIIPTWLPAAICHCFILAFTGLQFCGRCEAADTDTGAPLITNITQILQQRHQNKQQPFEVQALVTYYSPQWPILTIQDAVDGLYVPCNATFPIASSNQIRLSGVIQADGTLVTRSVQVLTNTAPMPPAKPVALDASVADRYDSQYVKTRGVITGLRTPRLGQIVLDCATTNQESFRVHVPEKLTSQRHLQRWWDCLLEISGVLGVRLDERGAKIGHVLWLASPEQIQIVNVNENTLFSASRVTIEAARIFDTSLGMVQRKSIQGLVTWQEDGKDFYIEDATGGIHVQPRYPKPLPPGTPVDVVGYVAGDFLYPILNESIFKITGPVQTITPRRLAARQVLDLKPWSTFIEIPGQVMEQRKFEKETEWMLQDGQSVFYASLGGDLPLDVDRIMKTGNRVMLSGICIPKRDQDRTARTFELILRFPRDARMLQLSLYEKHRALLTVIGCAFIVVAAVGAWGLGLRYQVKRQTRLLQNQVQQLTTLDKRLEDIIQNASDLIYTHDLHGNITSINNAAEKLTGYTNTQALTMNVRDIACPEHHGKIAEVLKEQAAGKDVPPLSVSIRAKDGTFKYLEVNTRVLFHEGTPCEVLCVARDVSERRLLEEQLRQSQKMEAIGHLAGGVAHDFNNILTVIKGQVSIMLEDAPPNSENLESLRELDAAANRAANLTRQLLAFSRRQVLRIQLLNINEVINNLGHMLRRLIREDIQLNYELIDTLPAIEADPSMLEQVIMNLVVNARDAMPDGGCLTVKTNLFEAGSDYLRHHLESRPGKFVVLTIKDTGSGMDETTRKHLFEPFFTTKSIGKGTGLGLATVYGIVTQHKGWIEVESEPQKGTTFHVFIPAASKSSTTNTTPVKNPESPKCDGVETILVVEDEAAVRRLAVNGLRQKGYDILEAANGVEALEVWGNHKKRIHLLLTDMVMPGGISGRELALRCKEEKSDIKIVYTSGHSLDAISGSLNLVEGLNFLPKPYEALSLAKIVRTALDS